MLRHVLVPHLERNGIGARFDEQPGRSEGGAAQEPE